LTFAKITLQSFLVRQNLVFVKKIILENALAFLLLLAALGATVYFYKNGQISFLSPGKNKPKIEEVTSELLFTEKEYHLLYKDWALEEVIEIARFEDQEKWQGDGDFDFSNVYEGKSSLALVSQNHQISRAVFPLEKDFDIDKIAQFRLFVFLKTPLKNLEEANLIFEGEKGVLYQYPLRELTEGWNCLVLPRSLFSESSNLGQEKAWSALTPDQKGEKRIIHSLILQITSRPKTMSVLGFDLLTAEESDRYLDDWNTNDNRFLSLARDGSVVNLRLIGFAGQAANLKKITGARDYTFQARFIPTKSGGFGFFLRGDYQSGYGYYLTVGGESKDAFSITKRGIFSTRGEEDLALVKGKIKNFKVEIDMPYWLKATLKGSRLALAFSIDGKNFVELGNANDNSFSSGGVGLAVKGDPLVLVDDISFAQ